MIGWMQQLIRCSLAMTALVGVFYAATVWLRRRYAPKWFYAMGMVILLGFLVPFRPTVPVTVERPASSQVTDVSVQTEPVLGNAPGTVVSQTIKLEAKPPVSPWQIAFWIWLVGTCGMLAYQAVRHLRFLRAARRWSSEVRDPQALAILKEEKFALGLQGQDIAWRQCACVPGPMLVWHGKPVILFPEQEMAAEDLRLILRHELVHYQRRDLWGRAIMIMATALHWFNPAVYLLSSLTTLSCEMSCDDRVIGHEQGTYKHRYAMSIIGVARQQKKGITAFSTSFHGGKETMKKRITSIMEPQKKRFGMLMVICAMVLTFVAGSALAVSVSNTPAAEAMNAGTTSVESAEPHDASEVFAQYAPYGLIYDATSNTLTYNGQLVRYFEDIYPVDNKSEAGISHYTPGGVVDVHAVRDLTDIKPGADGGYDPSGTLLGVMQATEEAFRTRDTSSDDATPVAGKDIQAAIHSSSVTQVSDATDVASFFQFGGDDKDIQTREASTTVESISPEEWGELFDKFVPYGLTYDDKSGDLYYQGKLVRYFEDSLQIGPNTYDHFLASSNENGEIDVKTVFDTEGNLIGITPDTQAEYDARTRDMFSD